MCTTILDIFFPFGRSFESLLSFTPDRIPFLLCIRTLCSIRIIFPSPVIAVVFLELVSATKNKKEIPVDPFIHFHPSTYWQSFSLFIHPTIHGIPLMFCVLVYYLLSANALCISQLISHPVVTKNVADFIYLALPSHVHFLCTCVVSVSPRLLSSFEASSLYAERHIPSYSLLCHKN